MSATPQTPLVQISGTDEVAGALVPAPDSSVNFVDDERVRQWLNENLGPLLSQVRDDASEQKAEWAQIRRMALLKRDETAAYEGRSQAYLPVYKKARETRVSHLSQGLFPSDTYIDCDSPNPQYEAATPFVKAWMMHQLERSMALRSELKPFLRSLTDYGLGVGKIWWEKPPQKQTRLTKLPGVSEVLLNYGEQPWSCVGARFKSRSVYSWYIWPVSVNSIEEASLVFEDIQVSKQFVNQQGKAGIWKNVAEINATTNDENAESELRNQLSEIRGSSNLSIDLRAGELANWTILTECWLRMPVPRSLYRPGEEVGSPVPVKVVYCGGIPIEARRNPFWHQRPPYVMQRLNEMTDSFYGVGMGRDMLSLQSLINDLVNQTNDNGIYGLNPIIKYNPNIIVGPLEPLAPGRMLPMTDTKDGMVFDRPPVEQLQYGMMLTNQFITYANDMSGVPAVLQGSGAKGGAKTATGSQILQSNVKGELQDLIEDIELRVLMPLLDMVHSLGQQYEAAERWFAISGGDKIQFRREQLEGEFTWRWVASSQAVNRQMRAQGNIQFAQLAASLMPLLQMQGKMFDPAPLLRRIYEDALGQRNFDSIIKAAPLMPGMMPGAPGMAGPPGAEPQEPRSAVEQAPGGGMGEMAPGEGEEFMQVREGADQMAAAMGEQGGYG